MKYYVRCPGCGAEVFLSRWRWRAERLFRRLQFEKPRRCGAETVTLSLVAK